MVQQEEPRQPVVADQVELVEQPAARLGGVRDGRGSGARARRRRASPARGRRLGVLGRRVAVAEVDGRVEVAALGDLGASRSTASGRSANSAAISSGLFSTCSRLPRRSASQASSGLPRGSRPGRPAAARGAGRGRGRRWSRPAAARAAGRARRAGGCGPGRRCWKGRGSSTRRPSRPNASAGPAALQGELAGRRRRQRAVAGAAAQAEQAAGVLAQASSETCGSSRPASIARWSGRGGRARGDGSAGVGAGEQAQRLRVAGDVSRPAASGGSARRPSKAVSSAPVIGRRPVLVRGAARTRARRRGCRGRSAPARRSRAAAARSTSSSGCEAPSRNEKAEWQCSST